MRRVSIALLVVGILSIVSCLACAAPGIAPSVGDGTLSIVTDAQGIKQWSVVPTGPGEYRLVLSVYDGTRLACYQYTLRLTLPGPNPPVPPPEPPTPPDPTPPTPPTPTPTPVERAEQLAYEAAMRLPADGRTEDAAKLGAVYQGIAEKIPDPIDTPEKLITAARFARELTLGSRARIWDAWTQEVGTWLDGLRTAGVLKTMDDYKAVWLGLSKGLAKVK